MPGNDRKSIGGFYAVQSEGRGYKAGKFDPQPGDVFVSKLTLYDIYRLYAGAGTPMTREVLRGIVSSLACLVETLITQDRVCLPQIEPPYSWFSKKWLWRFDPQWLRFTFITTGDMVLDVDMYAELESFAPIEGLPSYMSLEPSHAVLNQVKSSWVSHHISRVLLPLDMHAFGALQARISFRERIRRMALGVMSGSVKAFVAGIPFAANAYESVVHGGQLRFTLGLPSARSAISVVESARDRMVAKVNHWKGAQVWEPKLPLVLGAVLQNARTPADIFRIATQMRQTDSAKAFREWTRHLNAEQNIRVVAESMREVSSLAAALAGELDARTKVTHQFSFIPVYTIGIEKRAPAFLERHVFGKRHLVFLTELFNQVNAVRSLERRVAPDFDRSSYISRGGFQQIQGVTARCRPKFLVHGFRVIP